MGAVIGTLIAETIVLILYVHFSKEIIDFKKIIFLGMMFLVAGTTMFTVLETIKNNMFIENLFLRLVIEVGIGGIIYCVFTFLGLILSKKFVEF